MKKADLDGLSEEQKRVTQEHGTEAPFSGKWLNNKEDGTYLCICCGHQLFSSSTKYDSNSGWPSFWDQIEQDAVVIRRDNSHGMIREEAVCAQCDAHLGHRFSDGPQPTGQRYCINSASLDFRKKDHG